MAVLYNSSLIMSLNAGMDENGEDIVKRKSFNNVKIEATDDQLLTLAQALAPLQQYPVISIERTNNIELR